MSYSINFKYDKYIIININNLPSTALVEKKAKFLVSNGFSLENSVVRDWGSDSPVSAELST